MIKKLLLALLVSLLAFGPAVAWVAPVGAWETPPTKEEIKPDTSVKEVLWEGACDLEFMQKARTDIKDAQANKDVKTLKVTVISPGGPVITCLETARLMRKAHRMGLKVEVHATALCASGCTFILAAGSPGSRFITREAFFLVHPPQSGGGYTPECVKYVKEPKTVEDKIKNTLLNQLRDAYVAYTGQPSALVETWLTCDKEIVGGGELAVSMKIADKLED